RRVAQPITALHARGFVDAVVCNSGLLARRIGEPKLYFLSWRDLAQTGALDRWEPVYTSPLGNLLLLERRLMLMNESWAIGQTSSVSVLAPLGDLG
ncbi:MAG: hypothetical protein AAF438_11685, partial [Pseudomonadota bacterium]